MSASSAPTRPSLSTAEDLERLSTVAFMLGRDDDCVAWLERAHLRHLEGRRDAPRRALRRLDRHEPRLRGEIGPASGWLGRGQRLARGDEGEAVEHGYMLMPLVFQHEAKGEFEAGAAVAGEAARIAERFGDRDVMALATHAQGQAAPRPVACTKASR